MRSFFFSQLAFSFFYMFLLFPSPRLFYNDRSQILWGGESIFIFVKKITFIFLLFTFFSLFFAAFHFAPVRSRHLCSFPLSFAPCLSRTERRRVLRGTVPSSSSPTLLPAKDDAAAASSSAAAAPPPRAPPQPFGFLFLQQQREHEGRRALSRRCRGLHRLAAPLRSWSQRPGKAWHRFEGVHGEAREANERRGNAEALLFLSCPRMNDDNKKPWGKKGGKRLLFPSPSGPHPNRGARRGPPPHLRVDHQRRGRAPLVRCV